MGNGVGGQCVTQPSALPSLESLALKLQAQIHTLASLLELREQFVLRTESWPQDLSTPEPHIQEEN